MTDAIGRIWDVIIAALVFILFLGLFLFRLDDLKMRYISDKATSFVDTCRTTGELNPDNYYKFYQKVYRMGSYTIDIERRQKLSIPNASGDGMHVEYFVENMDTLMEDMYGDGTQEQKIVPLNSGDQLTIMVTRNRASISSKLMSFFLHGATDAGSIVMKYSGTVGNNGDGR